MAIYLTGDIHGNPERLLYLDDIATEKDYVIILGDFGVIWNQNVGKNETFWLNWLNNKPWMTLFIDGNHENFERLLSNEFPMTEMFGGTVRRVRNKVIYLLRGEYYNIDGKTFFCMGGASSHDIQHGVLEVGDFRIPMWQKDRTKLFRINRVSWWKEELPTARQLEYGEAVLAAHSYNVDYILTHTPSYKEMLKLGGKGLYDADRFNVWLDEILDKTNFKMHFCGHMHITTAITSNAYVLYTKFFKIDEKGNYKIYDTYDN